MEIYFRLLIFKKKFQKSDIIYFNKIVNYLKFNISNEIKQNFERRRVKNQQKKNL